MSADQAQRVKYFLEKIGELDIKAFKEICPHPVLVVMGGILARENEFQTRVSTSLDELGAKEGRHARFDPNARVFPVAKLPGANPYSQMIIIGRTSNTDIQLQSSGISKMHAFITWQDGPSGRKYKIADGKSRNGTWLGEKRLSPQRVHDLQSGAVLGLGRSVFLRFYLPEDFFAVLSNIIHL